MRKELDATDYCSKVLHELFDLPETGKSLIHQDNLNNNCDENNNYLKKYFPRSFAEHYCIFQKLFQNQRLKEYFCNKDTLRIFDFGCAQGAASFGVLQTLYEHGFVGSVELTGCDGNQLALDCFHKLISEVNSKAEIKILPSLHFCKLPENEPDLLQLLSDGKKYDLIIACKSINEMHKHYLTSTKELYLNFLRCLSENLDPNGLQIIVEVNVRDEDTGKFYGVMLSEQVENFVSELNSDFQIVLSNERIQKKSIFGGSFSPHHMQFKTIFDGEEEVETLVFRVLSKKDFAKTMGFDVSYLKHKRLG